MPLMLRSLIKPAYLSVRKVLLRLLVHSGPAPKVPSSIRSLLVITDRRLGDVCLSVPVFQSLCAAYPGANITILTPRTLHTLVEKLCSACFLIDYEDTDQLQKSDWDVVIDLSTDYPLKAAKLARSLAVPIRIGFDVHGRGRYFNIPLLPPTSREHIQQTYARALEPLGIPFRSVAPSVVERKRYAVVVHPGATHPTQKWPAEYFAELIRRINSGAESCVVVGSRHEQTLVNQIVGLAGSGATSTIVEDAWSLASIVRASEVLICNSSGPLHLASLFGTPTVSFMGPTVKEKWWPLGPNAVVLRRDALPCIGCNSGQCRIRTHACMREIIPDDAYAAYFQLKARLLLELST
jgi:ADP-heptose:LPS heptosyltransferase